MLTDTRWCTLRACAEVPAEAWQQVLCNCSAAGWALRWEVAAGVWCRGPSRTSATGWGIKRKLQNASGSGRITAACAAGDTSVRTHACTLYACMPATLRGTRRCLCAVPGMMAGTRGMTLVWAGMEGLRVWNTLCGKAQARGRVCVLPTLCTPKRFCKVDDKILVTLFASLCSYLSFRLDGTKLSQSGP